VSRALTHLLTLHHT